MIEGGAKNNNGFFASVSKLAVGILTFIGVKSLSDALQIDVPDWIDYENIYKNIDFYLSEFYGSIVYFSAVAFFVWALQNISYLRVAKPIKISGLMLVKRSPESMGAKNTYLNRLRRKEYLRYASDQMFALEILRMQKNLEQNIDNITIGRSIGWWSMILFSALTILTTLIFLS